MGLELTLKADVEGILPLLIRHWNSMGTYGSPNLQRRKLASVCQDLGICPENHGRLVQLVNHGLCCIQICTECFFRGTARGPEMRPEPEDQEGDAQEC